MAGKLPASARIVPAIVAAMATAIGVASLTLPPPISDALRPGVVPAMLAAVALIVALVCLWRPGALVDETSSPGLRPLLAAAVAVAVLALGTRTIGIAATSFISATVVAVGVNGVMPKRALAIGAGFAVGVSMLFAIATRQPLPILPPGLGW